METWKVIWIRVHSQTSIPVLDEIQKQKNRKYSEILIWNILKNEMEPRHVKGTSLKKCLFTCVSMTSGYRSPFLLLKRANCCIFKKRLRIRKGMREEEQKDIWNASAIVICLVPFGLQKVFLENRIIMHNKVRVLWHSIGDIWRSVKFRISKPLIINLTDFLILDNKWWTGFQCETFTANMRTF